MEQAGGDPGGRARSGLARVSVIFLVIGALVAVTTLLLVGSTFQAHFAQSRERHDLLKADLDVGGHLLATNLSLPVWNLDRPQVDQVLDNQMENPVVQAVSLLSESGQLGRISRFRGPGWTPQVGAPVPGPAGTTLEVERPVVHGGETLGRIRLTYSTRFLDAELHTLLLRRLASVALLDLLLVIGSSLLLWKLIFKPLQEIQRLAQLMIAGDPTAVPKVGQAYVGELASLHDSLLQTFALLQERFQALQVSEEKLQVLLQSTSDLIWSVDREGRLLTFNVRFAEHFRQTYGTEPYLGATGETLLPRDRAEAWAPLYRRSITQGSFTDEYVLADGRTLELTFHQLTQNGAVHGVSVFGKDVTDRKRAQAELASYREHLEDMVSERTRELEDARAAADAANESKSTFLANMSHEIRTPMNAVLGMTHLALQTDLTDKQRQYLLNTRSAADSLLGIINDILDFSKIEAGKLQMDARDFLLEDVLERVTHLVGGKAAEKRLEFMLDVEPDVPPALVGDPLRLGQVLTNLCSNAVKFTEAGEIVVRVRRTAVTTAGTVHLLFSVRDTGIGMTPSQTQALFQPFSQVDASSTRRFAGSGLGLAISKRLVELMGGRIQVASRHHQGSEFSFSAIFGVGRVPPAQGEASARPDLRILVVDDNPSAREILTGLVQGLGYQARAAASGEEGLAELERAPFDLVLMDWQMPGMDGLEAARRIRRGAGLAAPPKIVMVTAFGDDDLARAAQGDHLDGILAKPVTASTLFDTVMGAFGKEALAPTGGAASFGLSAEDRARLHGARVLLVEDNEFNQQVATELLELMGVTPTLARDGWEALSLLHGAPFDAVLMDLQMPVMDGYEATQKIRADAAFDALPILAMTAHAMTQERERCRLLGMNDYITKPIDPQALAATLARWVGRRSGGSTGEDRDPAPVLASARPQACAGIIEATGLACFSGHAALYEKMLRKFQTLKEGAADEIRSALAGGDLQAAAREAHSMIAVAGTIGALELSSTARALQDAILAGAPGQAGPLMDRFEDQLATVLEGLRVKFGPDAG